MVPDQDVKLSITPLIDVTFLLLIFFMCTIKFRTLDQKVAAWLPKKRGLDHTEERIEPEKIVVELLRGAEDTDTRVRLLGASLGAGRESFLKLDDRLTEIAGRFGDEEPEVRIDAGGDVPHCDVVRCVDACIVAGLTDIHFRGAMEPR